MRVERLVPNRPPQKIGENVYLRFGEAEAAGQLFPLGSYHVVILLKGSLQPQQLRGREGRADPFGLACEGPVQK